MSPRLKIQLNTLDEVVTQPLTFDGLDSSVRYLEFHTENLDENDELVEVFLTMTQRIIYIVELGTESIMTRIGEHENLSEKLDREQEMEKKKTPKAKNKELERRLMKCISKLNSKATTFATVYEFLVSLPMTIKARWNMLAALLEFDLITDVGNDLRAELAACASEQDLSCRCDEFVVELASRDWASAAELIHKALTTPVSATRESVLRGWLGRLVKREDKSENSEVLATKARNRWKCLNHLLIKCRENAKVLPKMDATTFREISGITTLFLNCNESKSQEPFEMVTYNLLAYFSVLIACKNQGSRLKLSLESSDQTVIRGLRHADDEVAQMAIVVCSKYGYYPKALADTLMHFKGRPSKKLLECLENQRLLVQLNKEVAVRLVKETLNKKLSDGTSQLPKRWVDTKADDSDDEDPRKKRRFTMDSASKDPMAELKTALRKMHPTLKYPSVARATEGLQANNVDVRFFCDELFNFVENVIGRYKEKTFDERKITSLSVLFVAITRCPLRIFIDSAVPLLRQVCAEKEASRFFHNNSMTLLKERDENVRPLVLELIFEITCSGVNSTLFYNVWFAVRRHENEQKKKIMAVMVAKVMTSKDIDVRNGPLYDMIRSTLGIVDRLHSPQLLVAAVAKLVNFRVENERKMLFTAFADSWQLDKLLNEIILQGYPDEIVHLVLFFIGRFQLGAFCFYSPSELRLITNIIKFCRRCIWVYRKDRMILGMAVDAICGYLPWSYIRDCALGNELVESEDPVEKLVKKNIWHHYFYGLIKRRNEVEKELSIHDYGMFPRAERIQAALKLDSQSKRAFKEEVSKLKEDWNKAIETQNPDRLQVVSHTLGALCEKAIAMRDKASIENKKKENSNWKTYLPDATAVAELDVIGSCLENERYNAAFVDCYVVKGLERFRWFKKRSQELKKPNEETPATPTTKSRPEELGSAGTSQSSSKKKR